MPLDLSAIQVIHDPPDIPVQLLYGVINPLFQIFQQMGLQPLNTLFNRCLALGLPGRRRKDHHFIELLQILICRIEDQLVLGMLCNGGTEVVRHQILGNRTIVVQAWTVPAIKLGSFSSGKASA